ncbi:DUF6133 family protein [Desulfitibacter alkalitolerans]|uniref:DUF6133 family protein n=1 Tax=Desulfitibacter alkalitolerans TaxID=264641 RepID=UPI001FA6D376
MKAQLKTWEIAGRAKNAIESNKGEGFIDTAVKILISVVIGALLLAGLYMLFQDTILFSSRYKHDRKCYA